MKDEVRKRRATPPSNQRRHGSAVCSTSKPPFPKRTRSRTSKQKKGSTSTADRSKLQRTHGSRTHSHSRSAPSTGRKRVAQPKSIRKARGASAAANVAPDGMATVDASSVWKRWISHCRRTPSASQSVSSRNGTTSSPPRPISAGDPASSSCSAENRRSEEPFPGSTHASSGPLPAASSTAASFIDGDAAQLCLTPITASPTTVPVHTTFATLHFGGAGSGNLDVDGPPSSYLSNQASTNAQAAMWAHSPLPVIQQRGGEMRRRPSCAPESSAGALWSLDAPGVVSDADNAQPSPALRASSTNFPLVNTRYTQLPAALQTPLHPLAAAASMSVLDVPSVKPVCIARESLPSPPPMHQRLQSTLALEDTQHGDCTLKSSLTPADPLLSLGSTSPSFMSSSRSPSKGKRSSSKERSDVGHGVVIFPFAQIKQDDGAAMMTPQREQQEIEENGSPPYSRQCFRQCDHFISKSMGSLSTASSAMSIVGEIPPPPPPPPAQLSIGGGEKTVGRTPPPPPPRVRVPMSQLHQLDGSRSQVRPPSGTHGRDYAGNSSAGSSVASSSLWDKTGSMTPFLLSPVTRPFRGRNSSLLVPPVAVPVTGEGAPIVSDANGTPSYPNAPHGRVMSHAHPSHHPSSATSPHGALVNVQSIASADDVGEEEGTVELRQAGPPPYGLPAGLPASTLVSSRTAALSSVKNDPLNANVDKLSDDELIADKDTADAIGMPVQSPEQSTSPPSRPSVVVTITQGVGKSDSDQDHNLTPSSGGASGKRRAEMVPTIVQESLLVSSEISTHARLSKEQTFSTRQQELAQSFRNRIQMGVRAPRRQQSAQRSASFSRQRRRSSGGSTTNSDTNRSSSADRSGGTRRRENSFRRTKPPSIQKPVTALSFMVVAVTAVACVKLLTGSRALRARRHFEEVIAPFAAYRIQCRWRRHQQLRRVRQKMAAQLLVQWMRFKLQRLRRAKDASARLLQRVFRGEAVRSLHRYICEQVKRNHALDFIRRYVQRWEAQNLYRRLQMQRDERAILVSKCVQGSMQLFRAEQVEWNAIVQDGAHILQSRPCVSTQDWVEGVAALTGVVLDPRASNRICSPDTSSVVTPSAGSTSTAQLRECLASFAQLEYQLFRSRDVKKGTTTTSTEGSAPSSAVPPPQPLQSTSALEMRTTKLRQEECAGDSVAPHDNGHPYTEASTANNGASDLPTSSGLLATEDDLVAAYVQLLCRTEAAERVALEHRLLHEHEEFLCEPLLRSKSILYATTMQVPPLFSDLLLGMPSEVLLHQAARLFKMEREARCEIIQLYESIPLACLRRPMLNPSAKARHSELVRLLNIVDDPWSDAERSERRFYYETAAHKHIATCASTTSKLDSSISLSYAQKPSSIPLGADDADNALLSRLTSPSHESTHTNCSYALPTSMATPLQSLPCPIPYGTPSRPRVCMNVTASLPSHTAPLLPPPNNSTDSLRPEGGGVAETDKDNRHTNSILTSLHRPKSEVQSSTAIPSPRRRPRGPPLPLLRRLLQNPGRARSGTSRPPLQRVPVVRTHAPHDREEAGGLRSPLLSTYPSTTHFPLVSIRKPSIEQEGRDAEVGSAGSSENPANEVSQNPDAGVGPQLPSPSIAEQLRFTTTAHATSAASVVTASHLPNPRGFRARGSVTISSPCRGNATEGIALFAPENAAPLNNADLMDRVPTALPVDSSDMGCTPLTTGVLSMPTVRCAIAASPEHLASSSVLQEVSLCQRQRNCTPIPARGGRDTSDDATLLSASVASALPTFTSATSATSAARVSTLLADFGVSSGDFTPSPARSSSASAVAERGADGESRIPLAPQRLRPPTPPPRQCHNAQPAAHMDEAPERSAAHRLPTAGAADLAGYSVLHQYPTSAASLIHSHAHQPHYWTASHSNGRKTNPIHVNGNGTSSGDASRAMTPTAKTLLSPAAPVAAAVAAAPQPPTVSESNGVYEK
ncbi:hypothetical protein, conserved [Leishmania tarentolae]|uniref:Uncharacterized protein n=1 Tax=Leishmania tarentolae TaxID=5689 RepID=A0A640KEU2_LEITA|nr:hypothetical protein, conserved [Leishmania tarentolae]